MLYEKPDRHRGNVPVASDIYVDRQYMYKVLTVSTVWYNGPS
jgi:hypothetical protein